MKLKIKYGENRNKLYILKYIYVLLCEKKEKLDSFIWLFVDFLYNKSGLFKGKYLVEDI